ncbi:nucleotidyltransferase domain-containing protein [Actinopolymorpha rutila]|uniref:Aminoglycoside phosphotransferase n=1 Tax=Actinopolymorpha rutila TaxID=446787 RepID=A0A852Z545_9ACTN|nr:phosphotransferase [Actinopolymorpha rutila]NYH87961.1 aminoglycoside phosphotransferase [Actinopolymorpha rutila]
MQSLVEDSTPLAIVRDLFRSYDRPYWVAGGWAVDLFARRVRRPHSDVDIAILYRDVDYLADTFSDPRPVLANPATGERREWTPDEQLKPGPYGFVIPDDSHPCPITIMLTASDGDEWVYHRGTGNVRRPHSLMTLTTERGLPFVGPEVALLYKSPMLRSKDWQDFDDIHEMLDDERRGWLIDNLAARRPDHPWLPRLRRVVERGRNNRVTGPAASSFLQPAQTNGHWPTSTGDGTAEVPPAASNADDAGQEAAAMQARGDQILARFDTNVAHAFRVPFAWSNEVWLAEEVVVRVGKLRRNALSREVNLARHLPAGVGYPAVLGYGLIDGHEWMASARLPGGNLHEAWPGLESAVRKDALADLWSRLQVLHTTDIALARSAGCTSTRYYDLDATRAHTDLAELVERGALEVTIGDRLAELLSEAFQAMSLVPLALNHTDASPGNAVLTPIGQAIPIDLESACIGPTDLDLENLFRYLHFMADEATANHLAMLAADLLNRPGAEARMCGYAILRDLWALRRWFRQTRNTTDLTTCAPLQRLHSHATSTSWLHAIF